MLRRWIAAWRARLSALLGRRRFEAELDEELQFHLDEAAARHVRRGLSWEDARREAARQLGDVGLTKEAAASGKAHGIRVNAILPSAHTTLLDKHPDPRFRAWMARHFPAKAVAEASTCLVSPDAGVTGELFAVGGGLVRRIAFHESEGVLDPMMDAETMAVRLDEIIAAGHGLVFATQSEHGASTASRFPPM